MKQIDIDNITS